MVAAYKKNVIMVLVYLPNYLHYVAVLIVKMSHALLAFTTEKMAYLSVYILVVFDNLLSHLRDNGEEGL
jgi:hypothetical protein